MNDTLLNCKRCKTSGHMSLSIKLKVRKMRGLRLYSSYHDKKCHRCQYKTQYLRSKTKDLITHGTVGSLKSCWSLFLCTNTSHGVECYVHGATPSQFRKADLRKLVNLPNISPPKSDTFITGQQIKALEEDPIFSGYSLWKHP